jgi:hypothetical protein
MRISGFAFDVEFLYLAKKLGYRIAELPVEWTNDPDSRVKMMSDPFLMMKDLIKLYFRVLFNRPAVDGSTRKRKRWVLSVTPK